MSSKEAMSAPVDIRLSLSDWLLLSDWASAHVTTSTPVLIGTILGRISRQVQDS